ncbi:hypothetical protein [Micromonospora craniellae]|uniref:DUF1616 domain-containing protein n=1 Tax=Micromonospora craniellae TaxID=2294034 RepID=A0A372G6S4_9ACTN|nr:hypothetical protein [Micromonospora craniellae]QOC90136.1 hypothetical protein ID554_18230 [Micromonospora craniellae]RFS48476.1 hypothetical protein D0Q02_03115 [Micromonospora craniellae]
MPGKQSFWPFLVVLVFGLGAWLDWAVLRVPAGLVLILLTPGWLVLRLSRARLTWWYRAVLAAGISFALAMSSLLVLELFAVTATPTVVGVLVAGVTLLLAVADLLVGRFANRLTAAPVAPRLSRGSVPPVRRLAAPVLAGLLTVGLAATAWGVSVASERDHTSVTFTQVGLVPLNDAPRTLTVSVTNREGRQVAYRVVIDAPGAEPQEMPVTLDDGDRWDQRVTAAEAGTVEVTVHGGSEVPTGARSVRAVVL